MTEEFIRLLRAYWELSESCSESILNFRQTEDYEPKGRVPNTNFSYEHHGLGYRIQLDSGIGFDFDFYAKKVAGIFPYFLISYFKQVKDNFPKLSHLTDLEMEELFTKMVLLGELEKHPYKSLYKLKGMTLENFAG